MQNIRFWLLSFRPKTLTAALVPIIAGTALTKALMFPVKMDIVVYALLASIFIQIGTNLVNDAVDFVKGADTEKRLGPQRVTQSGVFSYKAVMGAAGFFFLLAVLCGIPLVVAGGWPIVVIGVFAVLMGYSYTAGPFPLAYLGLGDLFVVLFFGLVAVGGFVFLQTGRLLAESLVLGLQIGLHCAVLIAVNNLRDVDGDQLVNKKTLPVRFGKSFARYEIAMLCFLPYVISVYWWHLTDVWAFWLPLLTLPLALFLVKKIFSTEPGPKYNQFLAYSAALHLGFGLLISVGFLL